MIERHRDEIVATYQALQADIQAVLDKHFGGCLRCDEMLDAEIASVQGRPPLSSQLVFTLITSRALAANVSAALTEWIAKQTATMGVPLGAPPAKGDA